MSVQRQPWATHYRFFDFPDCKEYFIPKEGLRTWHDLKYQLDDHVHIDYRFIDIVVNNRKVFYDDSTLLEDVNIAPTDECVVLVRRSLQRSQDEERTIVSNSNEIANRCRMPLFRQALESMNNSTEKRTIYDAAVREFSKWDCLAALPHCRTLEQLRKFILEGFARQLVQQQDIEKQKAQIDEFLRKEEVAELKKQIFDKNKGAEVYGSIMRKLFEKYPAFRFLEIKHQAYVQTKLLGRELNAVKNLIEEVQRSKQLKRLAEQDIIAFKNSHQQFEKEEISNAISLAGNNLTLADVYLRSGPTDTSMNVTMCLKKTARLNLILQFFSQPIFSKLLPRLRQNRAKCQAFLDKIIAKYKESKPLLATLIKKYRLHVVTILTGVYVLEKEKDLDSSQIKLQEQLSAQQQEKERINLFAAIDRSLAEEIATYQVPESLSISTVRAASNELAATAPYLRLGGINRRFDFCNPTRENQQAYLDKQFRKDKELLKKLRDMQVYTLWLASLSQTAPLLFQIILRNKRYLDRLINDSAKK